MKKKPAEVVIDLFGVRGTARGLKLRSPGTVSKWKLTGLIPARHHKPLLELAKARKVELTPDMLINGV